MKHTFHNVTKRNTSLPEQPRYPIEKSKIIRPQYHPNREPNRENKALSHTNGDQAEMKEITQLICPSCINKSANKNMVDSNMQLNLNRKALSKQKEHTSLSDFNKKANEDLINGKISERAHRTYDATQSLVLFRSSNKTQLQQANESQSQSDFFTSTDHVRERAKRKSSQLEMLIRNHIDQFTPQEKKEMVKYYDRYVEQSTSINLKSRSLSLNCPPSSIKEKYSNELQSQIDQRNQRLKEVKQEEINNDKLALEYSMNQSGKLLKCNRVIHRDNEVKCIEGNERISVMKKKKMNEMKEINSKLDQEYLAVNRSQMSDYERQMMNKRNQMSNILVYNKKMDCNRQEMMEEERKNDILYKNKGYLRELLCQHGCEVYRCAICLRQYPKRVLTPVVIRVRK